MSSRLQDIAMKRKINGLIKLLSEAADTAAGTIEPSLENFNKQISSAADDTKIKVPGKDVIFSKSRGNWYVSGAGIASDKLTSILSDAGKKKLNAADKKKDQDLALNPTDFIASVKAVNFTRGGDGAWSDQTPVEPSIIKKYLFGTAGGDIDVAADSSSSNYFVHQDRDLSYVFTAASFSIMVTDKSGDPLTNMERLLDRTGLGERYKTQDKANVSPDIIKVIDDAIELPLMFNNLANAGTELKGAIGDIRTGFGKLSDLFSRDDLKVNFSFKDYGPTFERRLVVGRAGGLAAKDIDRMRETGYFKNQALPVMAPGNYKFIEKMNRSSIQVNVSTSGVTGTAGVVVDGLTLGNTYGSALYLYLKGYLTVTNENQQSATPPPTTPAVDTGKTPQQQWLEILGPLPQPAVKDGDKPGGIFFKFNTNNTDQAFPANYIDEVKKKVEYLSSKYQEFKKSAGNIDPGFKIVVIATGDPIGNDQANVSVSTARATSIKTLLDNETNGFVNLEISVLGEKLWKSVSSMQKLEKPTQTNKAALKYARFGTVYLVGKNAAEADYKAIALDFFKRHKGTADFTDLGESYRANLINEIRRIIKETK